MNDRAMDSAKCFKCALDQVFSCLYQDLYSNVLGINLFSISWRQKSKSIWEPEGNPISISLKPMEDEEVKHGLLTPDTHGLDEGLIAITQVDAAPCRCSVQSLGRPLSINWFKKGFRPIFF